jgi:hypothetical protein
LIFLLITKLNSANYNNLANKIIHKAEILDVNGIQLEIDDFKFQAFKGISFLNECKNLIDSLIENINKSYGLKIDRKTAINLAKETINKSVSDEASQHYLTNLIDMLEETQIPAIVEIEDLFANNSYKSWTWNLSRSSKQSKKPTQELEFELPDKMAGGFVCILAGSLICIIPGGQGIGLTLVGAGVGLTFDGLANGERPYYKDKDTGEKLPVWNQKN